MVHQPGPSTVVLRYPSMIQTQQPPPQHTYQMMKPRMMPPNAFGSRGVPPPSPQLIMQPTPMQQQQSQPIIYDPNTLYRTTGQQAPPPPLPQQIQQVQQPLTSNCNRIHI